MFSCLKILFSISACCDIFQVNDSKIDVKIKGYKQINYSEEFSTIKDIDLSQNEYYTIYKEVYAENNVIHKLGIARNVISLHIRDNDIFNMESGTLNSIRSNILIYTKENTQRYIDTKNKIMETVNKILQESQQAIDVLDGQAKNGSYTIAGLAGVIVVAKHVLHTSDKTAFMAVALLLLTQLILFVFSIRNSYKKKDEIASRIGKIYDQYKDVLDQKDLDKIWEKIDCKQLVENLEKNIDLYLKVGVIIWTIVIVAIMMLLGIKAI